MIFSIVIKFNNNLEDTNFGVPFTKPNIAEKRVLSEIFISEIFVFASQRNIPDPCF